MAFDDITNRCKSADDDGDPGPDGGDNSYAHIKLCDNSDLQMYHSAFPTDSIDDAVRSAVHEDDGELSGDDNIVLIDIQDTRAINKNQRQYVAAKMPECCLHESGSLSMSANKVRSHFYYLEDDQETKLVTITITVVFTGTFEGSQYTPGQLCVELRRLTNKEPPIRVGYVPEGLQNANTENEIGRYIIRHEQKTVTGGGLYEVVVKTAESNVNYSIVLGGSFASPLSKEVKREMAALISFRHEIDESLKQHSLLQKRLILLERKKDIESELEKTAEKTCSKCKIDTERLDLDLDDQDNMSAGEVASIVQQINDLKLEHESSYRLFSIRSEMVNRLASEIQNVVEEGDLLDKRVRQLKERVKDSEELLSGVTSILWGEHTSSILMSQLGSIKS